MDKQEEQYHTQKFLEIVEDVIAFFEGGYNETAIDCRYNNEQFIYFHSIEKAMSDLKYHLNMLPNNLQKTLSLHFSLQYYHKKLYNYLQYGTVSNIRIQSKLV